MSISFRTVGWIFSTKVSIFKLQLVQCFSVMFILVSCLVLNFVQRKCQLLTLLLCFELNSRYSNSLFSKYTGWKSSFKVSDGKFLPEEGRSKRQFLGLLSLHLNTNGSKTLIIANSNDGLWKSTFFKNYALVFIPKMPQSTVLIILTFFGGIHFHSPFCTGNLLSLQCKICIYVLLFMMS